MKALSRFVAACVVAAPAACLGHGNPVFVDVMGGKLVVSGGVADSVGYASQAVADPDPESWLTPSALGEYFTTLPSFDITGMNAGESISLEVVPRPDLSADGHPLRWLWHWNLGLAQVFEAVGNTELDILSQRGFTPGMTIEQFQPPANSTVKMADLLGSDLGEHKHYLAYFVGSPNSEIDDGVYGFFARLVAPGRQPSDPFLVALNLNIPDEALFREAALAINRAAGLAGDFDTDGDVDGNDLLAWQRDLGTTGVNLPADGSLSGAVDGADLAIWKSQIGRVVTPPDEMGPAQAVPEPASSAMLAGLAVAALLRRGFRG